MGSREGRPPQPPLLLSVTSRPLSRPPGVPRAAEGVLGGQPSTAHCTALASLHYVCEVRGGGYSCGHSQSPPGSVGDLIALYLLIPLWMDTWVASGFCCRKDMFLRLFLAQVYKCFSGE